MMANPFRLCEYKKHLSSTVSEVGKGLPYMTKLNQMGQIHGIKYKQILYLEFQLYKLSLRDS